jgi:hypothetical protein
VGNVWRAWIMAVIGAWFVASAWVFGTQVGEFVTFGGLTVIIALWVALDQPAAGAWRSWLLALISAWMALMPWVVAFGTNTVGTYTTMIVGLIGVVLSIWMTSAAGEEPPTTVR